MAIAKESIYTIGHSTRSYDQFLALLQEQGIRTLADVRIMARQRCQPHQITPFARVARERITYPAGAES